MRSFSMSVLRAVLAVTQVVVNFSTWAKYTCGAKNPEITIYQPRRVRDLAEKQIAEKKLLSPLLLNLLKREPVVTDAGRAEGSPLPGRIRTRGWDVCTKYHGHYGLRQSVSKTVVTTRPRPPGVTGRSAPPAATPTRQCPAIALPSGDAAAGPTMDLKRKPRT